MHKEKENTNKKKLPVLDKYLKYRRLLKRTFKTRCPDTPALDFDGLNAAFEIQSKNRTYLLCNEKLLNWRNNGE